jgi:hypothetical protein
VSKDGADQRLLARYCTHWVLTLLKIAVKPSLIPIAEQTKIRSFRRGIGTSEEVSCLKLFDLFRTIQYGVRNLLYDNAGGGVEPLMSVVSFDGRVVFLKYGLAEPPLYDDGVSIRSHDKSLLGSEKKQCCLISGGPSFSIYQGHAKLTESRRAQVECRVAWRG